MKKSRLIPTSIIAVSALLFAQSPAYATSAVSNGGFEADPTGSTTITGWTSVLSRVDLGVTSLGGCVSQDTSDYTQLRDWVSTADDEGVANADISMAVADADNANPGWSSGPDFEVESVSVDDDGDPPFDGSQNMLQLYSDMYSSGSALRVDYGYVVHGPAIVSDTFSVGAGRSITMQWKALGASDDYAVLGYLLNVDTCAQTEVIDSTGDESQWTTTTVSIPASGNYKFVFVGGTYDYSWGGAAGSYFYVDNILDVVDLGDDPAVNISIEPTVGSSILELPTTLTGANLKPNSPFTFNRNGVAFYTGTTDGSGNFTALVNLPNDCIEGDQNLTLVGLDPNDVAVTQNYSLLVDANCTALAVQSNEPQLAATGTDSEVSRGYGILATLLLGAGALFGIFATRLRRR
jgi:hypothetical protein